MSVWEFILASFDFSFSSFFLSNICCCCIISVVGAFDFDTGFYLLIIVYMCFYVLVSLCLFSVISNAVYILFVANYIRRPYVRTMLMNRKIRMIEILFHLCGKKKFFISFRNQSMLKFIRSIIFRIGIKRNSTNRDSVKFKFHRFFMHTE